MAALGAITNLVPGDDLDVTRTITGVPATTTLAQAWLYVKRLATDPDNQAVFFKSITSAAVAGVGQITDTGADGTGALLFQIAAADSALLSPQVPCAYGIQVKLSSGKEYTVETGTIVADRGVVQAS